MGIVLKQTIKGSFYSYIGVILGGINVAILFPIIFSEEQIGLINILITVSAISAQFASLGTGGIINYFFPTFNNKKNAHNSFFILMCLIASIGFLLFTIVYYLFSDYFLATKSTDTFLTQKYDYLLYPLTFFSLGFILTDMFSASTLNAVIGSFYKEILLRFNILILCILYFYKIIDFQFFIIAYVFNMAVPVIGILIYLIRQRHISLKLPSFHLYKSYFRKMLSVGLFYILTGLSSILATYIDKFMINYFVGLRETGIYSITNYFGTLIRIPVSSMGKISTPLIAEAIKNKDKDKLTFLFEKSSVSQILVGSCIFLLIWGNIDTILSLLPSVYMEGKWVVFYISLSHLFTCFLGVGVGIINLSKYYKYSTSATAVLGVSVVLFNFIFIKQFGIVGAAAATAISKFIFVGMYLFLLKKKMQIKTFHINYLRIIAALLVSFFVVYFIKDINITTYKIADAIISVSIRSFIALASFVLVLFLLRFNMNFKDMKNLF